MVVGGAKVMDKLPLIQNLSDKADLFLMGGGMAASFLSASFSERQVDLGVDAEKRALWQQAILDDALNETWIRGHHPELTWWWQIDSQRTLESLTYSNQVRYRLAISFLTLDPRLSELYAGRLAEASHYCLERADGRFRMGPLSPRVPSESPGQSRLHRRPIQVIGGGSTSDAVTSLNLVDSILARVDRRWALHLEFLEGKELPGIAALDSSSGLETG